MEFLGILGVIISVWFIVIVVKFFINRLFDDPSVGNNDASHQAEGRIARIIYDPNELKLENSILRKYTGTKDSLVVPRGVTAISNVELPIWNKSLNLVVIPRSVKRIGEAALRYCESVHYEGSEAEWQKISIGPNNFSIGWKPSWCDGKQHMDNYRVTKVSFQFNVPGSIWEGEETRIALRKNKSTDVSSSSQQLPPATYQHVINNAKAFAGLCYKIGYGGRGKCVFPVKYTLRTTSSRLIEVYATHTVHDDDLLEAAHSSATERNRVGVEWAYKRMIENYKLTTTELRSFEDVSDFMEFLQGGISGYNSCKRNGHDIEITQELGSVQSHEKHIILLEIKKTILSSYSAAEAQEYGLDILTIHF